MEVRATMLTIALVSFLLFGFALLTSLLKSGDSPLSEDNQRTHVTANPEVLVALRDVAWFSVFADSSPTSQAEPTYVAGGLSRMATALETIARRDGVDPQRFEAPGSLRRAVDELHGTSEDLAGSEIVHEALTVAAIATEELQQRNYPHLSRASERLKRAASRLRTDRVIADQHDVIEEYFDAASDLLLPMILVRR